MYPGRVNMKEFAYHDIDYRGRLHRVDYRSTDKDGNVCYKYAQVYTPYGYDPAKPYDILYLMHGGGGSADAAAQALAEGKLAFNPNVKCNHHGEHHHGEGHTCGDHGCGSDHCH